jgi:hypothetical protein
MIFTKMEVRQNRVARQIRERHFEIYRAVRVDGCLERGCAIAIDRRHFVRPAHCGTESNHIVSIAGS